MSGIAIICIQWGLLGLMAMMLRKPNQTMRIFDSCWPMQGAAPFPLFAGQHSMLSGPVPLLLWCGISPVKVVLDSQVQQEPVRFCPGIFRKPCYRLYTDLGSNAALLSSPPADIYFSTASQKAGFRNCRTLECRGELRLGCPNMNHSRASQEVVALEH